MNQWIFAGLFAALATASCPAFAQTSDEPREIVCGSTKLTIFRMPTSEPHSVAAVHLESADEKELVNPSLFFTGSFYSLCRKDRFLLVSDDTHFLVGKSFLMRGDGTKVAALDLGWGPSTGASDDHAIFWVQTHEGNRIEETRLRVFDLNGRQLLDRRFTERGKSAEVTHEGVTYRISVADPSFPG